MKDAFPILFFLCLSTGLFAGGREEVNFKSGDITLSGTVYLPNGEGPHPVIIFVHGSGPETRDNSSYSAKWMAKNGFLALAFDKRGTGSSEGTNQDWKQFSFESLANDVAAAIRFMRSRPDVDKEKIGLFATSQGGWVATLASQKEPLDFMIMRSVSVSTVADDRIYERSARLRSEGIPDEDILKSQRIQMYEPKRTEEVDDQWVRLFKKYQNEAWFTRVYPGKDPYSESLISYRKWYATIADFDPVPILSKLDVPIFWIFGDPELDLLSPISQSLKQVNQLKASGKNYSLIKLDGEGHNVKESKYRSQLKAWLDKINI